MLCLFLEITLIVHIYYVSLLKLLNSGIKRNKGILTHLHFCCFFKQ